MTDQDLLQSAVPAGADRRGYIEGFYGSWLGWAERDILVRQLAGLGCNSYLYAAKEDPCHRYYWRRPYDSDFLSALGQCTGTARKNNIQFLTGIAPGLDFNFADPRKDKTALFDKAGSLVRAGAHGIVLMFDDISDDLTPFAAAGLDEGSCHGQLAADLQNHLGCPVFLVPRLYADEIAGDHTAYAGGLNQTLPPDLAVFICGEAIVARQVSLDGPCGQLGRALSQPLIIWDNLYCNDYCPRRLFVGPYLGRRAGDPVMLNGTGLVHTDRLLLELMCGREHGAVLADAGVPAAFARLCSFFDHPVFTGDDGPVPDLGDPGQLIACLDELLWQWKSPLAREWYPYLFGLKQDILIASGQMESNRIAKTQTGPLASFLTGTHR